MVTMSSATRSAAASACSARTRSKDAAVLGMRALHTKPSVRPQENLAALSAYCEFKGACRLAQWELMRNYRADVEGLVRCYSFVERGLDSEDSQNRKLAIEDPTHIN